MLVGVNAYMISHLIIDILFGYYGVVYALRKIKAHMKEWDRLVTIRFNETQMFRAKMSLKKNEKKNQKIVHKLSKKFAPGVVGLLQTTH
jgi:hypothetical protein